MHHLSQREDKPLSISNRSLVAENDDDILPSHVDAILILGEEFIHSALIQCVLIFDHLTLAPKAGKKFTPEFIAPEQAANFMTATKAHALTYPLNVWLEFFNLRKHTLSSFGCHCIDP
jgi:hypothetical protein